MCKIRVYVNELSVDLIITDIDGNAKILTISEPVGENSTIRVFINNSDYTDKFSELLEFNNQYVGAGNLIGRYTFSYQGELENIVLVIDVEIKFYSSKRRKYLGEWKNNIYRLVSKVEDNFGVNYIRKYLIYSIYGYNDYKNNVYESIANILIDSYKKILKCYEYIMNSQVFKNTISKMEFSEYAKSNSLKSDIYNDIFIGVNNNKKWHEKRYIEYNTDEIKYLHFMLQQFIKLIEICLDNLLRLNTQKNDTASNSAYRDRYYLLLKIKNELSMIFKNYSTKIQNIKEIPQRALLNNKYRYIYRIYEKVSKSEQLIQDFSRHLEKENISITNYMNKLYEIALFQKVSNMIEDLLQKEPQCIKSKYGLMYRFNLQNIRINLYFPFCGDLSDINLKVNSKVGKRANLDIIISIELNGCIKNFIIDAKYKYYRIYDEDIGQMVRYANSITCDSDILSEVTKCYLVYPFGKSDKNQMCTLDGKYSTLIDDLTSDYMLFNEMQHQLLAADMNKITLDNINGNYVINEEKSTTNKKIEYNKNGSVKTFNIPKQVELDLFDECLYRIENNNYYFKWGKYLVNWENNFNLSVLLNKKFKVNKNNINALPVTLLEYACKMNKEKTIKFMNRVLWCVPEKKDEHFLSKIEGTNYYYKVTHTVNESFNRINYISSELDIYLEAMIDVNEFLDMFKFVDLDECYRYNVVSKEFLKIGYIRESTMGINIHSIYIDNKFCFIIFNNMEAMKVILYYLVLIKEVDIRGLLATNILSNDIRVYNKPGLIPGTCLFLEEYEYKHELFSELYMLSKLYNVDIKLKVDWNGG